MTLLKTLSLLVAALVSASTGLASDPEATVGSPRGSSNQPPPVSGPQIHFDSPVFKFGKAISGEIIKHDFYFTNTGSRELVLESVMPSCGCTTAGAWTRRVEPGGSGVIPVQLDTSKYDGPVTKVVTVTCNDSAQRTVGLQLQGTLWKAIGVDPSLVTLNLLAEKPFASAIVRITNTLAQPLLLSPPECTNQLFGAVLRTNSPGKDYSVVVSNAVVLRAGTAQCQSCMITLRTSLTNVPVLSFLAFAQLVPDLTISPNRLVLAAAPIPANQLEQSISIVNNSTNPLTVFEPTFSMQDAQVNAQVRQEGSNYTVALSFPPEFKLPAGKPSYFTAKTSNPRFPVIKVPIIQNRLPEPEVEAETQPDRSARPKGPADAQPARDRASSN